MLVVDDHPIVREGITGLIARQSDMEVAGEAGCGEAGVEAFKRTLPDVTLMDLSLPDFSGVEAIRRIRAHSPTASILVLTTFDGDMAIREALDAGAKSYLLKDMHRDELLEAVRAVAAGTRRVPAVVAVRLAEAGPPPGLTARETEVLRLIAMGGSNKQIADRLGISAGTVKVHVNSILDKLDVTDRTGAVTTALRRGVISL